MKYLIIPAVLLLIVGLCGCISENNSINELNKKKDEINTSVINSTQSMDEEMNKEPANTGDYEEIKMNLSKEDEEINQLIKSSLKDMVLIEYETIDCSNKEEAQYFDQMIVDRYKINLTNKKLSIFIYNTSSEPNFDSIISFHNNFKNNNWKTIWAMYDETTPNIEDTPDNRQEFEITFKKDDDFLSIMIFKNDIDKSTEVAVEYLH